MTDKFINTLFINRVAIYDIIIVSKDNTQQTERQYTTDRKDSTMKINFHYVRIKAWKDDEMKIFLFLDTSTINNAKEVVKEVGWKPIKASRAVAAVEVPMVEASTENLICECAGGIKHDFLWSDVETKFVKGVYQNA